MKTLLCEHGFGDIWECQSNTNLNKFHVVFKQRLIDNFVQKWIADIQNNKVMDLYSTFKLNFELEKYLEILPYDLRIYISRLRLASHSLRIQTGRYAGQRLERNKRVCLICNNNDIEDEYHFVLVCSEYKDIRKKYIKRYFYNRPSVFKFVQLLQCQDKEVLFKIGKYIKEAFIFRNTVINIQNE